MEKLAGVISAARACIDFSAFIAALRTLRAHRKPKTFRRLLDDQKVTDRLVPASFLLACHG